MAKTVKKCRQGQMPREPDAPELRNGGLPESAPADWMERLDQCHVAALVSPLHDRDTNPSGEPKKPHYHVLLMFESPADYESKVAPIFAEIGAGARDGQFSPGVCQIPMPPDNPEKAQYSPSEVRCMGGANLFRHEPANR